MSTCSQRVAGEGESQRPARRIKPHHRPKSLRILDENWRDNLPPFVPEGWRPLKGVPPNRGACPKVRPCAHVQCRYHLWIVVGQDRPGRPFEGRRPPTILRPTSPTSCALDLVDRNPDGLSNREIGKLFGITGERVRQLIRDVRGKLGALLAAADDGVRPAAGIPREADIEASRVDGLLSPTGAMPR
jgi:hypothetical protein